MHGFYRVCYVVAMDPGAVTVLADGDTTYHIVGTAHVSEKSVEEVREVILRLKPEVVCVELCQARYDALTQDTAFRDLDIFKVIREGKTLYLLAHLALGAYQRRMGAALGVKPGAEMLAAIEEARAIGARVELVDRDIHTTLKRTWGNLGLWTRSKMLSQLLVGVGDETDEEVTAADIERLKEPVALSEMLAESDFVVLALPLTATTDRLMDAARLAQMKPGAWLINVARGRLIDERALVRALRDGHLGGAILDTILEEPLPATSALWATPNLIITPHTSWSSGRVLDRSIALFCENLQRYAAGEPLVNAVDPAVGY